MRYFERWLFAAFLIPLMMVSCSPQAGKKIASVGGEAITDKELECFTRNHPGKGLDDLIFRETVFALALKPGDKGAEVSPELEKEIRRSVLKDLYLAKRTSSKPFTVEDARQFYFAHMERRLASHILLATREEAELARNRIKGGEPFADVARELSTDKATGEKGGDLGWIRKGMTVEPFEDALFSASAGDLAGPVKTEFGYHIIEVREIRTASEEEFARNQDRIFAMMKNQREQAESEKYRAELKAAYPLKTYDEVLDQDRTVEIFPGDEKSAAGQVAGRDISLKELKEYMAEVMKVRGGGHSLGAKTKISFLELMADDVRIEKAAEADGLERTTEFGICMEDRKKDAVCADFKRSFLEAHEFAETEMAEAFEKAKDKYRRIEKVRVQQIVVTDFAPAESALKEAKAGTGFDVLFEKYADREATGDHEAGYVDFRLLKNIMDEASFRKAETCANGEVIGPLKTPEGYLLLKIVDKQYSGFKEIAEVGEELRSALLAEKGEAIFDEYVRKEGFSKFKVEKKGQ